MKEKVTHICGPIFIVLQITKGYSEILRKISIDLGYLNDDKKSNTLFCIVVYPKNKY